MKTLIFSIMLLVFLASAAFARFPSNKDVFAEADVVKVMDGDTIKVNIYKLAGTENMQDIQELTYRTLTVRLSFIDAPELKQNYGPQAKEDLENQCGKVVALHIKGKDMYGRILAEVFTTNALGEDENYPRVVPLVSICQNMVNNGSAWGYKPNKFYKLLQQNAKDAKLGLWQEENPTPPWVWRKEHKCEY